MYSIGSYIQDISAYFPQALITQTDTEMLCQATAFLPARLTNTLIFEVRLGGESSPVDLEFSVTPQSRAMLATLATRASIPNHPIWEQLVQFAQAWSEPESSLYEAIHAIWLEFDMPQSHPIPVLFVDTAKRVASAADYALVREVIMPTLTGHPVAESVARLQEQCIRALPERRTIYSFGSFLARGVSAQRLVVDGLGQHLPSYLEQIGWQGNMDSVQQVLAWVEACNAHIVVGIDVDESIHSKIGIEVLLKTPEQQHFLLNTLVEAGLCLPEKRDAVNTFSRMSIATSDPNHPRHYVEAGKVLNRAYVSVIQYDLSHIKLVILPTGLLEAKGYVRVSQRWVNMAELSYSNEEI